MGVITAYPDVLKKNEDRPDLITSTKTEGKNALDVKVIGSSADPIHVQGASDLVTYTHTRPSITSGSSQILINASAGRKAGSYAVNHTTTVFYISYGTAAYKQGVALYPGTTFIFNTTQALNVYQQSGGALNLDVFEAS